MLCERITPKWPPVHIAAQIRALIAAPESVAGAVAEIIGRVRSEGDDAVRQYTRRFDSPQDGPAESLNVSWEEIRVALNGLDPAVAAGLQRAIENVERVATAALVEDRTVTFADGHEVVLRHAPVGSAAIYVPGGRAPYPSTVIMGAVTAKVAGVRNLYVCAPPGPGGRVHPLILAACAMARVEENVYRMGGAQAIAALAYGTVSIAPVDVIVGPGNLYVQEAKRQVSDRVGIDGFAGPSDLVVVADGSSDPDPIALDLLAQAEHGPGTLVVAISTSTQLLDELESRLSVGDDTGAVAVLVEAVDDVYGHWLAEALAPEHLELIGPASEAYADSVTTAGCLFVGPGSATAFGDYIAGSNHVLPTNGAGRFASGLSPATFRRSFAEVRISGDAAEDLVRMAAPVARAEGFEFHARSMEARIRDNQ